MKLGNNEHHEPEICEHCQSNTCAVCSNGPRGIEYRQAEAEARMRDMIYSLGH